MNFTLTVLGLFSLVGAGLSYAVHGGTLAQFHAVIDALLR
jgi:hypothetical protein